MPDDGSKENTTWPMPKFCFKVDLGEELTGIAFQEVSGMETETQIVEYRNGNSKNFSTLKMPGIAKYGNIIMKRGVFPNDNSFWSWYSEIKMNTIKRRTVIIKLLDEAGKVTLQWQLDNAFPTKITKNVGNEVAINTLEMAHEQLTITKG